MSKYRILECIRQGQVGGGETHVLELVEGMDKSLYTPIVLSFTEGPMIEALRDLGVETHIIHTERPFNFLTWEKVRKLIIKEKIDLVHAHGTRACSNVLHTTNKLKIPLIYTIHGWSFHPGQNWFTKKTRILSEKYLTNSTNLNICVSNSNRIEGESLFKLKNSIVIHNGTKLERVKEEEITLDIRKELSIDPDTLLIGFIGRMTFQKAPLVLLKSFSKLKNHHADVRLLMVGDGDLKKEAIQCAEKLGISNKVIFQNFRTEIPAILKAIDIYCLPSLWEGFSIGLLEALAMAKTVVASGVNGTLEIISDRENGLLVKPNDDVDLTEKLAELISNKDLRLKLGLQAYATVKNKFSTSKMISATETQYQVLLK